MGRMMSNTALRTARRQRYQVSWLSVGPQRAILPTPPKSAPITITVDRLRRGYGTKERSCFDICRLPQVDLQTYEGLKRSKLWRQDCNKEI